MSKKPGETSQKASEIDIRVLGDAIWGWIRAKDTLAGNQTPTYYQEALALKLG